MCVCVCVCVCVSQEGELDNEGDGLLYDVTEAGADGTAPTGTSAAGRPLYAPILRFNAPCDSRYPVNKTFYRQIKTFTADDPVPLVEGGAGVHTCFCSVVTHDEGTRPL